MLLKIMERKNLNKGYNMSDRIEIDGLEDVSPNLRKFVERRYDQEVDMRPYFKNKTLEVMFYIADTRLRVQYDGGSLHFWSVDRNVYIDSINQYCPGVDIYLRVKRRGIEEVRMWIGEYNAYRDDGETVPK